MQAEPLQAPAPKGLKAAGIVAVVAAIGVVAAGAVVRRGDTHEAQTWSDARSVPTVHLIAAKGSSASDALTLPGTMQAWNAAKLYARVGGYVSAWYKDIGAVVGAGSPLGKIDTPELDQQIVSARAAMVSAKAQARHAPITVRAPFAGTVTSRNSDIGDLVGPGASVQQPMFSVADTRKIRIYVNVPQNYSAGMTPGLTATLTTPDYPSRSFSAHVIGNSGAIAQQTGTFQVQLIADNSDGALKPGGYAQVKFDVRGQGSTVQIPSSALIFRAKGTQVATVSADRHVHLRSISVGRDLGQTVEVTSGLSGSQQIVDNPPDSLADGELVRVEDKTRG